MAKYLRRSFRRGKKEVRFMGKSSNCMILIEEFNLNV